jgi:hypothetical protein
MGEAGFKGLILEIWRKDAEHELLRTCDSYGPAMAISDHLMVFELVGARFKARTGSFANLMTV